MKSLNPATFSWKTCVRKFCGNHLALLSFAVLGGSIFAPTSSAQNVAPVDVLVFEGQTLSGSTTIGGVIANLSINESGAISFFGSTSTGQEAVFSTTFDSSTAPVVLTLEDTASPDGGTFSFNQVNLVPSPINSAGQTSFSTDTGAVTSLFIADATNGVSTVASGTTVPGIQVRSRINDAGQVLVVTEPAFSQSNLTLFNPDGTARNVANFGQTLPGIGGTIDTINGDDFANDFELNNEGQVVFETTSIDGASFATDSGLFFDDGTQLIELVREGGTTPFGGTFSSITSDLNIDDNGTVVFRHNINVGPSGTPTIVSADSSSGSAVLTAIVQEGDAAPNVDGTDNSVFLEFNNIFINNEDQVVFEGLVDGDDIDGLFLYDPVEGLQAIFREGDLLPGEDVGGSFFGGDLDADVLINDLGQVVFGNTDINGIDDNDGIFFFDPETDLITTLAVVGDSLAGIAGTIEALSLDDNSFNNEGQLIFEFLTTEGISGIATFDSASLAAVPEPSCLGLLALAALMATRRKRKC